MPLRLPALYPLTDATRPEPLAAQIQRLGLAGFSLVQFRGKPMDARAQGEALSTALARAETDGGWPRIVVNDRADLAVLAVQEGHAPWGLHLGQEDLPPTEARALSGLGSLHLGTSTHGPSEWARVDAACDHAGVGPFRATSTKGDHALPIGLKGLAAGCAALRGQGLAPIAIGGLRVTDASACFEAGAESLAMVGAVHEAADPRDLGWEAQLARWQARPVIRRGQGLVLVGVSGSGKSTLGAALAQALGLPFHDLDAVIEARTGLPISEIFHRQGEAAFRALEHLHLPSLLGAPAVLALGGGTWEDPANRAAVAEAGFKVLWLAEPPRHCWERVGRDVRRPLAGEAGNFLARCRLRLEALALEEPVSCFGRTPEELTRALLQRVS